MKRPHYLLRVAALVSSVLLVGGFVSYSAGAFDWLTQTSPVQADSGRNLLPDPEGKVRDGTTQPAPTMMSGTKSFSPTRRIQGITPAKVPASDLDIPIAGNSPVFEPPPSSAAAKPLAPSQSPPPGVKKPTPILMHGTKALVKAIEFRKKASAKPPTPSQQPPAAAKQSTQEPR